MARFREGESSRGGKLGRLDYSVIEAIMSPASILKEPGSSSETVYSKLHSDNFNSHCMTEGFGNDADPSSWKKRHARLPRPFVLTMTSMEDTLERLLVLLHRQETYRTQDYIGESRRRLLERLENSESTLDMEPEHWQVDERARRLIVQWMYNVMDYFHYPREAVAIAMNFSDRMVSAWNDISKRDYQLLNVSCMVLATKLSDNERVFGACLPLDVVVRCTQNEFTKHQLIAMEFKILGSLNWYMNPPTAFQFLYYFVDALGIPNEAHDELVDAAVFMIETSVADYSMTAYSPCVVAMAALSNTCFNLLPSFDPQRTLQVYLRLDHDDVMACRNRFYDLQEESTRDSDRINSPVCVCHPGGNVLNAAKETNS